jgi:probable HAF family extracellular repeat protein
MTALGSLAGPTGISLAQAINDMGQISGQSTHSGSNFRAFLWDPDSPNGASGTMTNLGTLPPASGAYSRANGIGDTGVVVGTSSSSTGQRGFVWTPSTPNDTTGSMSVLGPTGTLVTSQAMAINASGEIVGVADGPGPGFVAFRRSASGGLVDLNTLLEPVSGAGWILTGAVAINDHGQIAGYGTLNGVDRGFLLTPVPEPSSLAVAALGVVAFATVALRRRGRTVSR